MKNGGNNKKRFELLTRVKTKTFEKKPSKGGTPAKDSILNPNNLDWILEAPNEEKEYNVCSLFVDACKSVEKNKKDVILYINI